MSHTNNTTNYALPQFVGTDTPGWLTDVNGAMSSIDAAIYARQQAIATNANNISAMDSRLTTTESAMSDVTSDINDINADIIDIEARNMAQDQSITDLTSTTSSLSTLVSSIQSKMPVVNNFTLLAANWASGMYLITNTNITANSIINIGLAEGVTAAEAEAWSSAAVYPGSITAGTGFTINAAGTEPTIDIAVTYTVQEV